VQTIAALHRNGTAHSSCSPPNLRLVFFPAVGYHIAMNNESVDNIASKLADAVPEGLRAVRDDLEQNFRSVLRSSLNKLDLVTREEFEVQRAVLARTREKLAALEAKLKELEQG
jgi:BMFP domain-containing protein YqiC